MLALIDADVLRYEVASIGENNGPDEPEPMYFDRVAEYLDERIAKIMYATEAEACLLFLTNAKNFRHDIAVSKPYKGNRKQEKPFHFANLTAYMNSKYDVRVKDGLEADDLMSWYQLLGLEDFGTAILEDANTVICTRDKDLRMIPGWHYGWECGAQPEEHIHWVTHDGELWKTAKGKVKANGMRLFYLQLLMGDATDNIPGLPGMGEKGAYNMLKDLPVHKMFEVVQSVYHDKGYDDTYLLEQGQLLWMTRELTDQGEPVLWQLPN